MKANLRRYLYQKAAREQVPLSGTFELTPRCNMNCRMCYIRMSEEEMRERGREITAAEWIHLAEEMKKEGMLFLLLTGGEPFLRKDFKEIYTALARMGLVLTINTNGTLITEETVAWLKENPPARINITLYGASNETYERLCGNPHGFTQATRAIELLRESGIFININASFTNWNLEDMEAIYAFAKERKISVTPAVYMFPPVRSAKDGKITEGSRLTASEAGAALFRTKLCSLERDELQRLCDRVTRRMPQEETDEECTRAPDEHMGCMVSRSSCWVTWDGRMTPCGMMNMPTVRPFEQPFKECWKELLSKVDEIFLPAECRDCKKRFACHVCGALALAEGQGDSTKKPEYLCEMTATYIRLCQEEKERGTDEKERE